MTAGNIDFVEADFFNHIPALHQDIYYLRNIVHNWPDKEAARILKNICDAMGPSSRLILHEYVLQYLSTSHSSSHSSSQRGLTKSAPAPLLPNYGGGSIRSHYQDIRMLFVYNAKERTFDEFIDLGKSAGLAFTKIWDLADTYLMEFKKESP